MKYYNQLRLMHQRVVFSLKTKSPIFTNNQNYSLSAGIKTGNFGLINPGILYQQKLNNKVSVSLSSEYILANGKYKFSYTNGVYDTTAIRNNGDVERFRLEASLFGKLNSNGKWHAQVYSFISNRGLPGAIVANKFNYNQRIWDRNLFIQGSVEKSINKKLSILANAKLAYGYTRFLDPEYVTINGFLDNRFKEREAYLSIAANYKISTNWSTALASDYQYQDLKANIYRFAYPNRNSFLNVATVSYQTDRLQLQTNILSNKHYRSCKRIYFCQAVNKYLVPQFCFHIKSSQKKI